MIRITGKVDVFVNERKLKDGRTIRVFSTSIDAVSKTEEKPGRVYFDVRFGRDNFPFSRVDKWETKTAYVIDVTDGWVGCEITKRGEVVYKDYYIFINAGNAVEARKIQPKTEKPTEEAPF